MKTILEELYNGHIFPAELIVPQDPEYRPLNQKISEIKKTWEKKLSTEDYQSLEILLKLCCESRIWKFPLLLDMVLSLVR